MTYKNKKLQQPFSGFYNCYSPVFDEERKIFIRCDE